MRLLIMVAVVVLLMIGAAGGAGAQTEAPSPEPETGRLQFVHAAVGAPALSLDLYDPARGLIGMWIVEPGATLDMVPHDVPLLPGIYSITVMPPTGGATGGSEIGKFDVPVAADFTTVVTVYADQHGRLLFINETPEGEETIRPLFEGTLVVRHDVADGPTVDVVVWVLEYEDRPFRMGRVVPGGMLDDELEAGPHTLVLYADGEIVGRRSIFITDDKTTVVKVSDVLEPGHREHRAAPAGKPVTKAPPAATEATPSVSPSPSASASTSPSPRPAEEQPRGDGAGWFPAALGVLAIVGIAGAGVALAHRVH